MRVPHVLPLRERCGSRRSRVMPLWIALTLVASSLHAQSRGYEALVTLFKDWRAFQQPPRAGAAYDYRPAAMAAQKAALAMYQQRLRSIDPRAWPIPQQVDYHIVRAEM